MNLKSFIKNTLLICILLGAGSAVSISAQSNLPPMISAHRGNTGTAPENTLSTYKKALQLQVEFIEIDVRTTQDGELIILHDGSLERTTNGTGSVKNWLFADLKNLSAGKSAPGYENERIPSLSEVCQLVRHWNTWHRKKTYLYVDCKEVEPSKLINVLQHYQLADSSCFYGNDRFLSELKNAYPGARVMPSLRRQDQINLKIQDLHPYAFDADFNSLTKEMVDESHTQGIRVFVDLLGPLDTVSNYRKAKSLGIDLIQTDKPQLVFKTLQY
ncbi:glycerophosphodiester phosphodiesterase family protein [Aquirufa sp. 5-AUSEE-100C1]|jgi:glycerophosphoryl diester phosphodiesterase